MVYLRLADLWVFAQSPSLLFFSCCHRKDTLCDYLCLYTSVNIKTYQYITRQISSYPVNISWQTYLYPVYISLGCLLILAQSFLPSCLKHLTHKPTGGANLPLTAFPPTSGFSTAWLERTEVFSYLSWKLLREFCSICSVLPLFLLGFMPSTPRMFTEFRSILSNTISTTWQLQWARGTYLTIVLRNQGRLTMEGTASSIRGCVLMKFRVSSGNSLEVTYFSNDVEPAQQPGLNKTRG